MSSQLNRMASHPHSWTNDLMSLWLDRMGWQHCWVHRGAEPVEEGRVSDVLVLLVTHPQCSRDSDLGRQCTTALEGTATPKGFVGPPWRREVTPWPPPCAAAAGRGPPSVSLPEHNLRRGHGPPAKRWKGLGWSEGQDLSGQHGACCVPFLTHLFKIFPHPFPVGTPPPPPGHLRVLGAAPCFS